MISSFLLGLALYRLLFKALNRYLLKNSSSIETLILSDITNTYLWIVVYILVMIIYPIWKQAITVVPRDIHGFSSISAGVHGSRPGMAFWENPPRMAGMKKPGDDKVQSPASISEGYTPDFTGGPSSLVKAQHAGKANPHYRPGWSMDVMVPLLPLSRNMSKSPVVEWHA